MKNNFFPSRWPIMCAAMTGASDLDLALAVDSAGAMPSLVLDRYDSCGDLNFDLIHSQLTQFKNSTGHSNLVLAVAEEDLLNYTFLKLLESFKISHLELLPNSLDSSQIWNDPKFTLGLQTVKKFAKIMIRVINKPQQNIYVDAYCIKGMESAGFGGSVAVKDLFKQQKTLTASQCVIPYGGVGTPDHVKYYMERGASGVAVGTLFAASKESCLSQIVKEKICATSSQNLSRFADTGQQALILDSAAKKSDSIDWNRETSLRQGLHGNGKQGHVYLGQSIDYVSQIRSCQEIVEHLIEHIKDSYE